MKTKIDGIENIEKNVKDNLTNDMNKQIKTVVDNQNKMKEELNKRIDDVVRSANEKMNNQVEQMKKEIGETSQKQNVVNQQAMNQIDEVKSEMRKAIRISFSNSGKTRQWKDMFGEGRIPEPEEFIRVIALNVVA
jgi:DNA anti-recombination protein RmuC